MLLATSSLPAADLLVEPGNPLAYQTLQAALNAAQPGDRILIGAFLQPGTTVITKSVTIESVPGAIYGFSLFVSQELRIQALSPGLPLTFRRLNIGCYELGGIPGGIRTVGALQGEIRLDQVDFVRNGVGYGGGVLADLNATTVWLRECRFTAYDVHWNLGCIDLLGTDGPSCLKVVADTLHLEDCNLRAGSAIHLAYGCCFGSPPNCTGQFAQGGLGGTALDATTRNTTIVRCQFSDGNGGTVESNPGWLVPVTAGAARPSTFGGQTGVLDRFGVTHEQAQPGAIGPAWVGRGPIVAFGPAAPLSLGGPVEPGTFVGVTLNTVPGSVSGFLIGLDWGEIPTPFGMCWVTPFDMWLHGGGGTTQTYAIPAIPQLRGIPIVVQALQVFPTTERLNPSGVAVR
jgi:hypothetical protein